MAKNRNAPIIDAIMKAESWPTYSNRAADAGGPTKGGITLATLRAWRRNPATTIADLMALPEAEARQIYEQVYIIAPGYDGINDDGLREVVVDAAVMSGSATATRWLQAVLGLRQDGVFGSKTRAAVNAASPVALGLLFSAQRAIYYADLVQRRPSDIANIEGWVRRAMLYVQMVAIKRLA
ncbi:MAG: glycosyl hydrolase 108 family protein [Alphaproteobacteria bacterium]|nr:glycosyl hydrolase 108 family protein [Alphaproteobacteria bacterium]